MCCVVVPLDVNAHEMLDRAVVCGIEAVEESCLEVQAEIVVREAEQEVINVEDQVNGFTSGGFVDKEGV